MLLDGIAGTFSITKSDKTGDDFWHHRHLKYISKQCLHFAGSSQYFLKADTNSPEMLLGYHNFDRRLLYQIV